MKGNHNGCGNSIPFFIVGNHLKMKGNHNTKEQKESYILDIVDIFLKKQNKNGLL